MTLSLKFIIVLGILLMGMGCRIFDPEPTQDNSKIYPKDYSIVFCDFTSSVDTTHSIELIKQNAISLQTTFAARKKIEFYTISKNNNSSCLFTNTPMAIDPLPSEKINFENSITERSDSLKKLLNIASSSAAAKYRSEPNSCIIDCIERAIRYFRNYSFHDTAHLQLFILSDMLECCTVNGRVPVCIEPPVNIKAKIDAIAAITDSNLSFREFKNIEVNIILSSNNRQAGYSGDFYTFWQTVFKRYGYDKVLYFSVKLPDATDK
ncbi:hypothetical protein [Ferruginibacter profundus]